MLRFAQHDKKGGMRSVQHDKSGVIPHTSEESIVDALLRSA